MVVLYILYCRYVQSWPKVLRTTQKYIFTKFATSVALDIFVRCYYGILKYNYKHFISGKGFIDKCCWISVCPWCFSWREVASLLPFLTPGHSPKVFTSLCMQMHSHLPAAIPEKALYWWCPNPATESTLGDGPGACWTFLGALKPSSQQFNCSPWSSWWSDKWLIKVQSYWQQYPCLWSPFCAKQWWRHVFPFR